MLLFKQSPV